MSYIKKFVITFLVFIAVDIVWLGFLAQPIYNKYIGSLLREEFLMLPALIFYILFIVGLIYFAIDPALKAKSQTLALKNSALFGFMTYMTYELTNYAVIATWPWEIVFIDIVWGVVLSTSVGFLSYKSLSR